MDGIEITPLMEGGEVIEPLGDRVLGRVALEDVVDPFTGEVIVKANKKSTKNWYNGSKMPAWNESRFVRY